MPRHLIYDEWADDAPHGDPHPGIHSSKTPTAHVAAMPSTVQLDPCPVCHGKFVQCAGHRERCQTCNEVGFINLPTDRASLDEIFYATGRGSPERVAVMAQRYALHFGLRPWDAPMDRPLSMTSSSPR